jgi:hypothetical protein
MAGITRPAASATNTTQTSNKNLMRRHRVPLSSKKTGRSPLFFTLFCRSLTVLRRLRLVDGSITSESEPD